VAKRTEQPEQAKLGELLRTIARDGRELLVEQLELFRAEVGQELRQAGVSAAEVAAGGGLTAAGGLLTGFMAAHLLNKLLGVPLWACYGLVGGGIGAAGVALLRAGTNGIAGLQPLPQTTESLGENLEWLAGQLNPAAG